MGRRKEIFWELRDWSLQTPISALCLPLSAICYLLYAIRLRLFIFHHLPGVIHSAE